MSARAAIANYLLAHQGEDVFTLGEGVLAALAEAGFSVAENDRLRAIIDDTCEVLEHYHLPEHAFHYRRVLEGKVALTRAPATPGKQTP